MEVSRAQAIGGDDVYTRIGGWLAEKCKMKITHSCETSVVRTLSAACRLVCLGILNSQRMGGFFAGETE